ncbi:MAG: acylphosphatase [archaeon]
MRRVHLSIYGIVQGVFFRHNTSRSAYKLGVKGFVRNTNDHVEAVFEGSDDAVEELVNFCRKGPKGAVVQKFEIKEEEYKNEFEEFEVRA